MSGQYSKVYILPLSLVSLLVITGCNIEQEQEFEPTPDVFALMRVHDTVSSHLVFVEKSYSITDTIESPGIDEAIVRVIDNVDTFNFPDSFWNEHINDWEYSKFDGWYWGWLEFNDTTSYDLEVIYPNGDVVTGKTYMPSPVTITWPGEGDTVSLSAELVQPNMVSWNNCLNTSLYTIQCAPDVDTSQYNNFTPFLFSPSFTTDTTYPFFAERALQQWVTDTFYYLRVTAYGTEYASYIQLGLSLGHGNLTDQDGDTCYGVFSGIAFDSVRIFITE